MIFDESGIALLTIILIGSIFAFYLCNLLIPSISELLVKAGRTGNDLSKPGKPSNLDNYRGIIILTIMSKIFEFIVNNRLCFVNDAFDRTDTFNGRFLKGVV